MTRFDQQTPFFRNQKEFCTFCCRFHTDLHKGYQQKDNAKPILKTGNGCYLSTYLIQWGVNDRIGKEN